MNKTKNVNFVILAIISVFGVSPNVQALTCPKEVVLQGANFINHQNFPDRQQIANNFNQSLVSGNLPVWGTGVLDFADQFVNAVKHHYDFHKNQLVLVPDPNQGCKGSLDSVPYQVSDDDVEFSTDDTIVIRVTTDVHSPVILDLSLPSNCSACGHTAELFEFKKVSFSN